jgi:hypothetical protein
VLAKGLYDPNTRLGQLVKAVHGPLDPFARTSDAVARGNRKVFEEIGREFARFLAVCGDGDEARLEAFCRGLRDGDPPDGQRLVRQAFTRYFHARREPSAARRVEMIYLANLEIGLHEQTRLQPEIQEGLDSPAIELHALGSRILVILIPGAKRWWRVVHAPVAMTIGLFALPLAMAARRLAREVITDCLTMLRMPPDRALRLGHNLEAAFPDSLHRLADADVTALVSRFGCDALGAHDCGAEDWAEIRDRMHYIAHLFRALHEDPTLASPPFTDAQVRLFESGRIPDGTL